MKQVVDVHHFDETQVYGYGADKPSSRMMANLGFEPAFSGTPEGLNSTKRSEAL